MKGVERKEKKKKKRWPNSKENDMNGTLARVTISL